MPTNFPDLVDGTTIYSDHVDRYKLPVNDLETGAAFYGLDTGSGNAYAVSLTPTPSNPLLAGAMVHFKVRTGGTNTGAATLQLNGLAAIPIKKNVNQALAAGDITEGQVVAVVYDGTNFQLLGKTGGALQLDDLSDVTLTTPANLDILQRDAAGQFVNRALATADIASKATLDAHIADLENPHEVTLTQIGGQPLDSTLTSLAALGTASDKMAYTTGVDTWAETTLSAFARTLLDDADAATARATLGVGSGSGDVVKVGTPVDNQVGVWTGNGTLEGDPDFTWDGETLLVNPTHTTTTEKTVRIEPT